MTYELINTYHGTRTRVRPQPRPADNPAFGPDPYAGMAILSHSQVLRARRKLCGKRSCGCGGYAGEIGGRYHVGLDRRDDEIVSRSTYTLHRKVSQPWYYDSSVYLTNHLTNGDAP